MHTLISLFLWFVGLAFASVFLSNTLLPIFYGLPKSLTLIAQKKADRKLLRPYIISPAFWVLFVSFMLGALRIFWHSGFNYLTNNQGLMGGLAFGAIVFLYQTVHTTKGRNTVREEFRNMADQYAIDEEEEYITVLGERIYEKEHPLVFGKAKTDPDALSKLLQSIAADREISIRQAIHEHEMYGQRLGF